MASAEGLPSLNDANMKYENMKNIKSESVTSFPPLDDRVYA